ncbi:hypothetical protein HY310_03485 [Candidatus Microgenomates bacterium]|nr:hypothetical protein [Candidatus Microgenomates bacterium]
MQNRWLIIIILVLTIGAIVVDLPKTIKFPGWKFTRPVVMGRNLDIKEGLSYLVHIKP